VTIDGWKEAVLNDVRKRGLVDLLPMIDTLENAIRAVRSADWNRAPWDTVPEPDSVGLPAAAESSYPAKRPPGAVSVVRGQDNVSAPPSALSLAARLGSGRLSSRELTEACLDRIGRENGRLNAFIMVTAESARKQAAEADAGFRRGDIRSPLQGIPISLKDLIALEGVPTTAASQVRADAVAYRDALVVQRLKQAGAVIVGTCNLHEFAFGTTSEDSAYGPVHHPLDAARSPGGSSGGSAAAVAAGLCVASVGTDTGGSVRIPAAACGVVGLKPAYGEIPCHGVVPLARSLDHVGPLTLSVEDAWLLYRIMRGDTLPAWPPAANRVDLEGVSIGTPRAYFLDLLDDGVRAEHDAALARLAAVGVRIVEVDVPHASDIAAVYLLVGFAEVAAYHAPALEARAELYTPPVRSRLHLSRYVLAEDYVRARDGRDRLGHEVDAALSACDVLALPTLPIPAPPIGAASIATGAGRMPVRAATLRLTQLFNLTGHPAISLPAGRTSDGWPTGLQLVGPRGATERLLEIARAVEVHARS
jgi:aspartyl-tRNA(Asn)/glutamyl-tRNA(Gln) amidotransferase subunit A